MRVLILPISISLKDSPSWNSRTIPVERLKRCGNNMKIRPSKCNNAATVFIYMMISSVGVEVCDLHFEIITSDGEMADDSAFTLKAAVCLITLQAF